ncbi:MAG: hypothetical protein GTO40_18800 [Deltaproteobacteria bacterium]|nr:hypothetical protein [Deltaproteobacteria bacterium]
MVHSHGLSAEEKVTALFQPDTLLPTQYYETLRNKAAMLPEKRLMLAVLEEAIGCFKKSIFGRSRRQATLFRNADTWILGENDDWLFSFDSICENLGIEPAYLRKNLVRWKTNQLRRDRKSPAAKNLLRTVS